MQKTLKKEIQITGIGMHSGKEVSIKIKPGKENSGIVFEKNKNNVKTLVPALWYNVVRTDRSTTIGASDDDSINTVEHLMAAFHVLMIDNAIVEIDNVEMPIMKGNSIDFVKEIIKAGFKKQKTPVKAIRVLKSVKVEDGDSFVEIKPLKNKESKLNIKGLIDYANIKSIQKQELEISFDYDKASSKEICENILKARTFGFKHELKYLHSKGLALGASLENAIGLDEAGEIMNKKDMAYPKDEFIRHKILDSLGDLYTLGSPLFAEVITHKGSHKLNNLAIKKLMSDANNFEYVNKETESLEEKTKNIFIAVANSNKKKTVSEFAVK